MIKTTLSVFLFCFLFASCSTYYYTTVNSADTGLHKNEDRSFTAVKQGVAVTHSFNAKNGAVTIKINNSTNDEYLIDRSRSFLIADNYAYNRANLKEVTIVCAFSHNGKDNLSFSGETVPIIFVNQQESMKIPENSSRKFTPVSLFPAFEIRLSKDKTRWEPFNEKGSGTFFFTSEDSPLIFNSYLTLKSDRTNIELVFDNTFYVSSFRSTSVKPNNNSDLLYADTYYYQKKSKMTESDVPQQVLNGAGLIGLEILKLALEKR